MIGYRRYWGDNAPKGHYKITNLTQWFYWLKVIPDFVECSVFVPLKRRRR